MKINTSNTGEGRHAARWMAFVAGFVTLLVYLRALTCDFIMRDDQLYVLDNEAIKNLDLNLLVWAFAKDPIAMLTPLASASFGVDYHFWGFNPIGYHLNNIVLHAINAGLVVLVADRLFKWHGTSEREQWWQYPAVLLTAGLLWSIHPLRVESVAWIASRKDVINGFFLLGSIILYIRYAEARRDGVAPNKWRLLYSVSLLLFALSLLSKSVSVVMPAMLLALDWYPLCRLNCGSRVGVILEKVPYLLLAAYVAVITMSLGAKTGYMVSFSDLPLELRSVVAGNALFEYLHLSFFPFNISPYVQIPNPIPYLYGVKAAASVSIVCGLAYAGTKSRALAVTSLFFLLPLLPVIGFFQNGIQAYALRYTYLSSIALSIAAAVILRQLLNSGVGQLSLNRYACTAVFFVLICCGIMTFRYIGVWDNTGTFWTRIIETENKPDLVVFNDRGMYFYEIGDYEKAINDFSTIISQAGKGTLLRNFNYFAFRGNAYLKLKRYEEALADFKVAISYYPCPAYSQASGLALMGLGRVDEAKEFFLLAGVDPGPVVWIE